MRKIIIALSIAFLGGGLGSCTTLIAATAQICAHADELRMAAIIGMQSPKPEIRASAEAAIKSLRLCAKKENEHAAH